MNISNSGEPTKTAKTKMSLVTRILIILVVLVLLVLGVAVFFKLLPFPNQINENSQSISTMTVNSDGEARVSGIVSDPVVTEIDSSLGVSSMTAETEEETIVSTGDSEPVEVEGDSSQGQPYLAFSYLGGVLIYSGDSEPVKLQGVCFMKESSFDGTTMGIAMDQGDDRLFSLFVYDGKVLLEGATEVLSFKICDDGSKVVYLSDVDWDDKTGTLFSYDVASGTSEKVADEVSTKYEYVISPDGKSIGYSADAIKNDHDYIISFTGYVVKDGADAEKLGDNIVFISISDKAGYMYYTVNDIENLEKTLYVSKNGNASIITKLEWDSFLFFNKDYSELLCAGDGATYLSIGEAEVKKISSYQIYSIEFPYKTNNVLFPTDPICRRIDVTSFKDNFVTMISDESTMICYLNSSYELSEIESFGDTYHECGIQVSRDNKSLCYVDANGDLLIYSNYTDQKSEPVKISVDKDIATVYASSDFETIYFFDVEGILYVIYGSGDPVEISSSVYFTLFFSDDESCMYYFSDSGIKDGSIVLTLNMIENQAGAAPTKLAEDVLNIRISCIGVVYFVMEDLEDGDYITRGEAFYSRDGKIFESVAHEAHPW